MTTLMRQFGLTRLEVETYVGLLEHGDSTAKALSDNLGMSRAEAYRILNRLLSRGLVVMASSSPTIYQSLSPSVAIRSMIQEVEGRARQMKELAPGLILELETLKRKKVSKPQTASGGIRLLTGRAALETPKEMFMRVQRRFRGIWPLERATRLGLLRSFVHSLKDGVDAQFIVQVTPSNVPDVEKLIRVARVRHIEGTEYGWHVDVVDDREMTLSASGFDPNLDGSVSIWSDNTALLRTTISAFDAIWRNAQDAGEKIAEVRDRSRRL